MKRIQIEIFGFFSEKPLRRSFKRREQPHSFAMMRYYINTVKLSTVIWLRNYVTILVIKFEISNYFLILEFFRFIFWVFFALLKNFGWSLWFLCIRENFRMLNPNEGWASNIIKNKMFILIWNWNSNWFYIRKKISNSIDDIISRSFRLRLRFMFLSENQKIKRITFPKLGISKEVLAISYNIKDNWSGF